MKRLAIFASGAGSNAKNIIEHFKKTPSKASVALIVTNNPSAEVLDIAFDENIESIIVDKAYFSSEDFVEFIKSKNIDFVILAGFLWMVPSKLTIAFEDRIVNIHPALLPKFGGKGMYGSAVHRAVKQAGEKKSGISIHFVNEKYDDGEIIFQKECDILPYDDEQMIEQKVRTLEQKHYPRIIESLLDKI
jgi:phosphoribosylglycinamide formyltransferase 1